MMTGNHYANNQKDPYVSTITYLSNWPYIVCTVTRPLAIRTKDVKAQPIPITRPGPRALAAAPPAD